MAALNKNNTSILTRLDSARTGLAVSAETGRARAVSLRVAANDAEAEAVERLAHADALEKALDILQKAGVVV